MDMYILIAGDFDLPQIDWNSWTTDHRTTKFKFIACNQHITTSTRGRGTDDPSVLDLTYIKLEGASFF